MLLRRAIVKSNYERSLTHMAVANIPGATVRDGYARRPREPAVTDYSGRHTRPAVGVNSCDGEP
jgi:hypothetical protein